jgi:hypothetical protein
MRVAAAVDGPGDGIGEALVPERGEGLAKVPNVSHAATVRTPSDVRRPKSGMKTRSVDNPRRFLSVEDDHARTNCP